MLYALLTSADTIILRTLAAFFISLGLSLSFGNKLIDFLHHHQSKGQPIREDGPQSHLLTKKGTPTMGGLLILGTTIVATFRIFIFRFLGFHTFLCLKPLLLDLKLSVVFLARIFIPSRMPERHALLNFLSSSLFKKTTIEVSSILAEVLFMLPLHHILH